MKIKTFKKLKASVLNNQKLILKRTGVTCSFSHVAEHIAYNYLALQIRARLRKNKDFHYDYRELEYKLIK